MGAAGAASAVVVEVEASGAVYTEVVVVVVVPSGFQGLPLPAGQQQVMVVDGKSQELVVFVQHADTRGDPLSSKILSQNNSNYEPSLFEDSELMKTRISSLLAARK